VAGAAGTSDLEQRVNTERTALALWGPYLISPGAAPLSRAVVDLRVALARDDVALAAHQRAARARAEAEARRQAAAAERARKQA
jgi:hypothetical protein